MRTLNLSAADRMIALPESYSTAALVGAITDLVPLASAAEQVATLCGEVLSDNAAAFNCAEANAIHDLLVAAEEPTWAHRFIAAHAAADDDEEDEHHDLDLESSASRQHFIDTGRYLRRSEVGQ